MSIDHNDFPSGTGDESQVPPKPSTTPMGGPIGEPSGHPLGVIPQVLQDEVASHAGPSDAAGFESEVSLSVDSALEFRVVRPGNPVRRLRLTGSRYTFGSGNECSIQLDDETLRPMHAVLLRDAHRILMRAYSVPLECNGARVTEATLRVGDIVRMGNYRLELLIAPGQGDASMTSVQGGAADSAASESSLPRDRMSELNRQFQSRFAECETRENRCIERESELSGREKDLWGRAESLQKRESDLVGREAQAQSLRDSGEAALEELDQWKRREAEAQESVREKESALSDLKHQLEQRQTDLEQLQAQWQDHEQDHSGRVDEAQRKLEQTQQQAQSANDTIGRMREEFATINEQLTELRERHSDLQERERREQSEHDRLRGELEQARDRAIDARAKAEADRTEIESRLSDVNSELQSTRDELESIREEGKRCQEELHEKLRETGEQLQAARAESEETRNNFEREKELNASRISELEACLADVADQQPESMAADLALIEELQSRSDEARHEREGAERVAEELRQTVNELQEDVRLANEESVQLKNDCKGANASIRQLELLVDQHSENQSSRLTSWEQESQQLRETIEELSGQLSYANAELADLRLANEALSDEMGALSYDGNSPDSAGLGPDQFGQIEQELVAARAEIDKLQSAHAETVTRLEVERLHSESILRNEIEQLRAEIQAVSGTDLLGLEEDDFSESEIETIAGGVGVTHGEESTSLVSESFPINDLESERAAETLTDGTPQTELLNESDGGQTWRMEPEQDSVLRGPVDLELSSRSDDESEHGARESLTSDSDGQGSWSEEGAEASSPDVESGGGVSWQDESPEQAVVDAIEDIEHNVEQAMADEPAQEFSEAASGWSDSLQTDASSGWDDDADDEGNSIGLSWDREEMRQDPASAIDAESESAQATDLDHIDNNDPASSTMTEQEIASEFRAERNVEPPLDWMAYMPGGEVKTPPEEEGYDSGTLDSGHGDSEHSAPETQVDLSGTVVNDETDESVWDGTTGGTEDSLAMSSDWTGNSEPQEPADSASFTESFDRDGGSQFDANPSDASMYSADFSGSADTAESEVGSLAEMLIRDLESEKGQPTEGTAVESDLRESDDDNEDDGPTMMLEEPAGFSDHDGKDGEWNHVYREDELAVESAQELGQPEEQLVDSQLVEPINLADSVSITDSVGGEDESIEAYMSRLLQRVQPGETGQPGGDEQPVGAAQPVVENASNTEAGKEEAESSFTEQAENTVARESIESEILVPRSQAPETKDLEAMRDLANQSARNAVARSIRVQARDTQMKSMVKLAMASSFVIMAAGVFLFVTWSSTIKLAMIGAFAVLAGVFVQEAIVLYRDARRRLALADESAPSLSVDDDAAENE